MKRLRKYLLLLLVVCFLLQPVFSQEQPSTITINTDNPWNVIDSSLMNLENEMNNMKLFSEQQSKQIMTLEKAYQDANTLYLSSEQHCQSLENDIQKWKTCSIVLGCTTITLTVVVIVVPVVMAKCLK